MKVSYSPPPPRPTPGLLNLPDTSLAHPSHGPPVPMNTWEPCASFSTTKRAGPGFEDAVNVTPKPLPVAPALRVAPPEPHPPPPVDLRPRRSGRSLTLLGLLAASLAAIVSGGIGLLAHG